MSQLRKIQVSLPESLLDEADKIAGVENLNRSEFVRAAVRLYIREKNKKNNREKLISGYQQMAQINLDYAEMCLSADNQVLAACEEKLPECE